jgi:hypothetical protein
VSWVQRAQMAVDSSAQIVQENGMSRFTSFFH